MMEYNAKTDEELLNELGYRQELKREFSIFQLFSVSFSIMSLVPSIASVLGDCLPAGPIGSTWGWLVPSALILCVGISLGELASAYPTSGGLYYWTYMFSPAKLKRPVSYLCAWNNTIGLISGMCSINYGFANMLLSIPAVAMDSGFAPNKWEAYGVFVAVTAVQGIMGLLPSNYLSKLQSAATFLNLLLVGLVCIALPIGAAQKGILNSGKWVFTGKVNLYEGWSYGGAFIMSWMSAIWTIGALDSPVHMSEEASNAATAAPIAICMSVILCAILGFATQAIIVACIKNRDIEAVLNTSTGQPLTQIILDCLGKKWAIALMTLMALASLMMGSSMLTAASRQSFSVARDGILPWSRFVRRVNPKTAVPAYALLFDVCVGIVIGLLILIDTTAANALFSLYSSSNSLAWMIPVFMRFFFPKVVEFKRGPFYIGKWGSWINNGITVFYLVFVVFILTQLPQAKPPTAQNMNYTSLINGFLWISVLSYYFLRARKTFVGPKRTLEEFNIIDGHEELTTEAKLGKLADTKVASHSSNSGIDSI